MRDNNTTISILKDNIIDMCRRKGWGTDGIQNPQHVTMAMTVETMELMEHFVNLIPEAEAEMLSEKMRGERIEIAEEMSDVLMYAMQLMYTLKIDVSKAVHSEFSDCVTPVSELKAYIGCPETGLARQSMRVAVNSRFVLEAFQWLNDADVLKLMKGGLPKVRSEVAGAFAKMFREILALANMLNIDISASIERKIAIVDKRVYPEDDPVR